MYEGINNIQKTGELKQEPGPFLYGRFARSYDLNGASLYYEIKKIMCCIKGGIENSHFTIAYTFRHDSKLFCNEFGKRLLHIKRCFNELPAYSESGIGRRLVERIIDKHLFIIWIRKMAAHGLLVKFKNLEI